MTVADYTALCMYKKLLYITSGYKKCGRKAEVAVMSAQIITLHSEK